VFVNLEIRTAKIDSTIFGEHLSAEYRVKTEGHGRTVVECKQRPERGNIWRLSTKRRVRRTRVVLLGCQIAACVVNGIESEKCTVDW
jgi:hypothetical protein